MNVCLHATQSSCSPLLYVCTATGRMDCKVTENNTFGYYGGFITAEFARDVILQTQYHNTSQENIAMFLRHHYNLPPLLEAFGKPYCFVNTGHHDVLIKGITKEVYVENVEWYLRLMQPECNQIIWISTTAPMNDRDVQKIKATLEWSEAVREMLTNQTDLSVAFLDVYHSSLNFAHRDNIHMSVEWYNALAYFLGDLLDSCTGIV
jgi:hypothetical protein